MATKKIVFAFHIKPDACPLVLLLLVFIQVWKGMRLDTIGVWRGISSAVGLSGTLVYQVMSNRNIGQVDSGMISVVFQFFCLSLSYASLFVDDFDTSTTMLIVGVCASRVGLWVFDLSVTQVRKNLFL